MAVCQYDWSQPTRMYSVTAECSANTSTLTVGICAVRYHLSVHFVEHHSKACAESQSAIRGKCGHTAEGCKAVSYATHCRYRRLLCTCGVRDENHDRCYLSLPPIAIERECCVNLRLGPKNFRCCVQWSSYHSYHVVTLVHLASLTKVA